MNWIMANYVNEFLQSTLVCLAVCTSVEEEQWKSNSTLKCLHLLWMFGKKCKMHKSPGTSVRVKVKINSRGWMTLCWSGKRECGRRTKRAMLLNRLMPLRSWNVKLFWNLSGLWMAQRRRQSTTIHTHWQFSMQSKHLSFETCQEQSNSSCLKVLDCSSLVHVIAGGRLREVCVAWVCIWLLLCVVNMGLFINVGGISPLRIWAFTLFSAAKIDNRHHWMRNKEFVFHYYTRKRLKTEADNALANVSPSMQTNAVRHYLCLLKSGQKSYANKHRHCPDANNKTTQCD